jgi:hypothetical protein
VRDEEGGVVGVEVGLQTKFNNLAQTEVKVSGEEQTREKGTKRRHK